MFVSWIHFEIDIVVCWFNIFRTHHQVTTYGRSLQRKFGLASGTLPDSALREFLLKDGGEEENDLETIITDGKLIAFQS